MKNKIVSILMICLFVQTISNAQDKKIPFNKGEVKICSSKKFIIKGYDGNEVIIKSLHKIKSQDVYRSFNLRNDSIRYVAKALNLKGFPSSSYRGFNLRTDSVLIVKGNLLATGNVVLNTKPTKVTNIRIGQTYFASDEKRGEGLKKLGKKAEAEESGIFLKIEVKGNELIIGDDDLNSFFMSTDEKYEITIPNSVKLNWNTEGCNKNKTARYYFYNSSSTLQDFKGEVEISTALNELNLIDVSGPVSINTIGGNVKIEFDKTTPKYLYSVYSNNGFIDIKLPKNSNVLIDATADEILSDLDFNIVSEEEKNGAQQMSLKLGSGKVKMKLNAGFGNIYLRKK